MERQLGDLPPGFDTEQSEEIVGTGGPTIQDVSRRVALPKRIARANNIIFINTGYTINALSVQVLPANNNRTYLLIQNKSAAPVYFSFGNKANVYDGVEIVAGGNYEPYIYPSSSLHMIASVADSDVVIVEGNVL